MPVSTRSHHPSSAPSPMRIPHHGLKEKMKALTLLYEQQKQASMALKNPERRNSAATHHANSTVSTAELMGSGKGKEKEPKPISQVMRENAMHNPTTAAIKRNLIYAPNDDAKENIIGADRIVGFTCPAKRTTTTTTATTTTTTNAVARKLSLGSLEARGIGGGIKAEPELETISENCGVSSRILVFVRLRPMGKKEKESGSRSCVRIVNGKEVYLTEFASENDYLRLKRLRGRHFTFDASFPDSTSQQEVYSTTTAELVEGVLQGKNGSVFCYGATGAGKTYTMLGTIENPGVMVLAMKDLFAKIRQRSCDGNHVVHLSYLEVYNETVRDLLSPGRPLVLREDKQGIVASGLTQYRAYSTDEVMSLLQQGNQNRTTEPTRANETSSRSHAILQVVAEYHVRDAAMNIVSRVGKLSLIDLAGSERALATDQRTLRSIEGANINRSLLALSSCINALVEGKKHIPYRNSKLTQLLKDSLGGACNTVMIANISPSNLSFGETQNTLHWADRAKEIRTKSCQANEELLQTPTEDADQAKLLLEVQKENRELRMQLARQQQKLLTVQAQSLAANSSPVPSSDTSNLTPLSAKPSEKRRTRSSFLTGNCFTTPESKRGAAGATARELQQAVKSLEAEMERLKEAHAMQLKQKDSYIHELRVKLAKSSADGEGGKRIVTRVGLRQQKTVGDGELKSPKHRFESPVPTAKKRSFWDITTANSPSLSGRKTRSHVAKPAAGPSMLLQPGFARK